MDWKLFGSTLVIVFLAELGDKTQLTAMAAAAGSKSTVSVFLGAVTALTLSTLIAVIVGGVLPRFVPLRVLKIAAGVAFLLFGLMYLYNGIFKKEVPPETAASSVFQPETAGMLTRTVMDLAAAYEEHEAQVCRRLAGGCGDDTVKSVLLGIAADEESHISRLRHSQHESAVHLDNACDVTTAHLQGNRSELTRTPELGYLLSLEERIENFYRQLSTALPTASLRRGFAFLADSERKHRETVAGLIRGDT